jgi:predicted Na+-dependent transporter
VVAASLVSVGIYGLVEYLLGGPYLATKHSLAFNSSVRNVGVALLIAAQSFSSQPNVSILVAVFGMIQIIVIMGGIA